MTDKRILFGMAAREELGAFTADDHIYLCQTQNLQGKQGKDEYMYIILFADQVETVIGWLRMLLNELPAAKQDRTGDVDA